jgi:hypothetical protein
MPNKKDFTISEIAISNRFSIEAIVKVLVLKGVVNKEELIKEIHRLKQEYKKGKN